MKYLSVCSGIEAATVAWHHLGWEPVAFSEVEPFPSAVLKHHYPNVVNRGDMTKFLEWPDESIDVLVGGTPCQSFSVAGLRKGLADPRGNLMLTYLGIAQRYRPRWIVWENVPGVLSSNGGRDFGTFLGALVELGYGFAYRVLDAQWFGVAQRRRRVFVVGHLGDATSAAKVLFESESVCRNPAPSREKGQGVAANAVPSVAGSLDTECGGGKLTHQSVANGHLIGTITARMFNSLGARDVEEGALLPIPLNTQVITRHNALGRRTGFGMGEAGSPVFTISSAHHHAVAQPMVLMDQGGSSMDVRTDGTVGTLRRETHGHEPAVVTYGFEPGIAKREGDPKRFVKEMSPTIRKEMGDNQTSIVQAMAVGPQAFAENSRAELRYCGGDGSVSAQLTTGGGKPGQGSPCVQLGMAVRRLTPVECERLQGFPDNYTAIPWRNKPATNCPDGPRYKALGNSMAVPVMRWIGERIAQEESA